jgi:hypothetical protein
MLTRIVSDVGTAGEADGHRMHWLRPDRHPGWFLLGIAGREDGKRMDVLIWIKEGAGALSHVLRYGRH